VASTAAFIVEETTRFVVDRDLTWVLGDWRLGPDASINDYSAINGHEHGRPHRTTVTSTATCRDPLPSGPRTRAPAVINAATARIFAPAFAGHRRGSLRSTASRRAARARGWPYRPGAGDARRPRHGHDGQSGERFAVTDGFYPQFTYGCSKSPTDAPLRDHALDAGIALPPNPPRSPTWPRRRHEIVLGGGMDDGRAT